MSLISQLSPSNLVKYISPIRTAIEVERGSDGSKFQADVKPISKVDAAENLKGNVVDKRI